MPKQNVVSILHVTHLSHNNFINPVITDMNQSVLLADILRFTKDDSKNISRKNKCIRNRPAILQSLLNFSMRFALMKDSLHILKHCIIFI